MTDRTWSPNQQTIFDYIEDPAAGSALIEAVAGSGKTTTIVEAVRRLPRGKSYIFLAFNKSIATELVARGVTVARTFHSLTYSPVLKARKARTVDSDKLRVLVDINFSEADRALYAAFASKLVGLAKQAGVGVLVEDEPQVWQDIVDHHELELTSEFANVDAGIALARRLLTLSNEAPSLDFDDLLYLAVKDGVVLPKFDFVFVDEAQDTNAIQRALLRKIMQPGARLIAVGDPAQAIYGFRGADSESLNLIASEFGATRLPLSVSYRCARKVVEYARQWVSHIEPSPTAPEGAVTELGTNWNTGTFNPGDLVVCRTTAPLMSVAYQLLRERKSATVLGRDIGEGLSALVKRMGAKGIDALQEKLRAFADREAGKARAKKQEAKAQAVEDRVDAILTLVDGLSENERTVPALLNVITQLFAEKRGAVVLATIHKSKGLEAERVLWLNRSACPSRWAKQPWQLQQENNLCYVAATRAKSELVIIETKRKG